jgi:hypothetical protein
VVIVNPRDSAATHTIVADISDDNMEMHFRNEKRLFKIEERVIKHQAEQHNHYNNLNSTPHRNGDPPAAFATISTETIDFSIGFGFAALVYVSLEIFREFYVDFVDIRHKIRVFT